MAKIRKGDLVQVISGPREDRGGDRGKQGKVLEVLMDQDRVIVEGINYVTKHTRVGQTQRGSKTGGIETVEAPIHISNVALVDPDTKQPARVGFKEVEVEKDGVTKTVRERYFKPSRRTAKPAKATKSTKDDAKAEKPAKASKDDAKAEKPAKADKAEAKAPKAAKTEKVDTKAADAAETKDDE
ncbi:50S ribosomal protein L24 [Pseudoclavibacter chungangensis]|uniref:Large ribosomal subunit protein uL24 n=1 Tax=Pseudoclavibacter chungangensis TaxID=587635 RepID=A0A7J5C0Z3_9MICO|nr:50S ribosomal protein L24 [Pseudoclavibacter chungangensis]NYJ65488.1 large subunit ribosomal protein L24 [Pseudoclavibacter chungangensis]